MTAAIRRMTHTHGASRQHMGRRCAIWLDGNAFPMSEQHDSTVVRAVSRLGDLATDLKPLVKLEESFHAQSLCQLRMAVSASAEWQDVLLGYLHAHVARMMLIDMLLMSGTANADHAISAAEICVYGAASTEEGDAGLAVGLQGADASSSADHSFGIRWIESLEDEGWWVGKPILEKDIGKRVRLV